MRNLTFILRHFESESIAFLECTTKNGKPKIVGIAQAQGNVISLTDVRRALQHTKEVLPTIPPPLPSGPWVG